MYKIGMFSKMTKVTVKTLRHYDEIGLLKPGWVCPENGYRYYSNEEMLRLHRILSLKQIGFFSMKLSSSWTKRCLRNV